MNSQHMYCDVIRDRKLGLGGCTRAQWAPQGSELTGRGQVHDVLQEAGRQHGRAHQLSVHQAHLAHAREVLQQAGGSVCVGRNGVAVVLSKSRLRFRTRKDRDFSCASSSTLVLESVYATSR